MPTLKVGVQRDIHLPGGVIKRLRIRPGTRLEVLIYGEKGFLIPRGQLSRTNREFYADEPPAKAREASESTMRGEDPTSPGDAVVGVLASGPSR